MKKTQINFDAKALTKTLVDRHVQWQTELLIEYAMRKVKEIGDRIKTYHGAHHMDRTGNLLNSLCWGVAYNGRLRDYGFYSNGQTKSYKKSSYDSIDQSYLHEFDKEHELYLVEGRFLAEKFIKRYGRASAPNYWRVWFAILAPYWGYWEEGFTLVHGNSVAPNARKNGKLQKGYKGFRGASFKRFAVMSEFHDVVEKDLRPAKVKYETEAPEYSPSMKKHDMEKYANRIKNQYKYARDDHYRNR